LNYKQLKAFFISSFQPGLVESLYGEFAQAGSKMDGYFG